MASEIENFTVEIMSDKSASSVSEERNVLKMKVEEDE